MSNQFPPYLTPDRLACWYFRLNGFLTTENFIVHPDTGSNQRTDADLLATRFEHRLENISRPMEGDLRVTTCSTFANVIIAEVKKGRCSLNDPWTNRSVGNMHRVLKAVGCVPDTALDAACETLYHQGIWHDSVTTIRLFALGESKNKELPISEAQQLIWDDIIEFCVKRFQDYKRQKSSVDQWTEDGKQLKTFAEGDSKSDIRYFFGLVPKDSSTPSTSK